MDTLKNQAYKQILDAVLKKVYPVDYILKEKELSVQFGIGKSPVREALIELSKEGIVKSIPRAGYRIIQLTEKDIYETTELRLILETAVLDRIIANIDNKTFRELNAIIDEVTFSKDGKISMPLDAWWGNNIRFHLKLNAVAGNEILNAALDNALHRLWRAIAQLFWAGGPNEYLSTTPDTHKNLLKAMKNKDRAGAEKIFREDILSIGDYLTLRMQKGVGQSASPSGEE
ncbi:MAG: GntR family transcriptional regulator [Treponema sp.]|nr:GntR family transcriptional regulator [Treponema sp.]